MSVLPAFSLAEPSTVEEAVALKSAHPGSRYLGGGTDLIPNLRRGIGRPDLLISLAGIPELQKFEEAGGGLLIGAGVHLADLALLPALTGPCAAIGMAAGSIAGPGHRALATVGGNLCLDTRCVFYNQSHWWRAANNYCLKLDGATCHVVKKGEKCVAAYSGDLAPALLVLGAEVEIATPAGRRREALAGLFREDGQNWLELGPADLLVAVHVPPPSGVRSGYLKSRIRQSMDFPLAGVAAALRREGDAIASLAVAITGTNSRPILLEGLDELHGSRLDERALDALGKAVARGIKPMRTTSVPSLYRRHMAGVLARRLVARLYQEHPCEQTRSMA
jgi:4-hydroxybenzoyl-CoA reductase subunit beta